MASDVINRLKGVQRRPDELAPGDFETSAGQQGSETVVASLQADTALALREGRGNPIRLAVPAYGSDTLANDGTEQTFDLGHSITETNVTQDAVVWFGGTYYGTPDAIDYDANTVTVTGDNTDSTVHVFYISDDAATVEIQKATRTGTRTASRRYRRVSSTRPTSPSSRRPSTSPGTTR
jgi:hypothetical protein